MARIFKIKQLEAKKRALVAESEVCRQTLLLDLQNLSLYRLRVQRRFNLLTRLPWSLLLPLAGVLFKRRRRGSVGAKRGFKWPGLLRAGLMGFRLFRQYGPLLQGMMAQQFAQQEPSPAATEETAPAANI